MDKIDLYEELELSRTCSADEIKQSYKKLALKWHPDKNKGNEETATLKFQRVSEAYSILSDPEKRERYDKYGTINEEDFDFEEFMTHCNFQDLFGSLFGDLGFSMNFADFEKMGKSKLRGRAKNKFVSKAQMRREQKEAEKLMKEFTKIGFGGPDDDEVPGKKTKKKAENQEEDEWDTEEEYTDEEDEEKPKKGNGKKAAAAADDDDDFEDVDSDEEEGNAKGGFGGFGGFGGLGAEDLFMFPIFMDENTVEVGKKYKCKYDNKVFKNDDELFDHFDKLHKKDFKTWMKKKH